MQFRLIFILLSFFSFTCGFAENSKTPIVHPYPHTLTAIDHYPGTPKGQFKNDLIAVLDDGSAWKVHPTEQDKFKNWNIHDTVHISVRTSLYWFKREHKFEMIHPARNETVKVMLVKFPFQSLTVTAAESTYLYKSWRPYIVTKPNGEPLAIPCYSPRYLKTFTLSDGSHWLSVGLEEEKLLKKGTRVYVGANVAKEELNYFIAVGTELDSESVHWVNKLDD